MKRKLGGICAVTLALATLSMWMADFLASAKARLGNVLVTIDNGGLSRDGQTSRPEEVNIAQ